MILLHGFPEFWYGWRHQIPYLAAAGYRVWAPDQRGYNESDKPRGLSAYSIDQLVGDLIGLIDAAGSEKACLVGHDWGGGVAWWAAAKFPERIERMVILNSPHWQVFRRQLRRDPRQMLKSWYFLFFQIPWLPEALARWMMAWSAQRLVNDPASPPNEAARMLTGAEPAMVVDAWRQPGALTAMINWYRALLRAPSPLPESPRIRVPTLLIWGSRDPYLVRALAQPSIDLCDNGRLIYFEQAGHWLHHEEASGINPLIGEFLHP